MNPFTRGLSPTTALRRSVAHAPASALVALTLVLAACSESDDVNDRATSTGGSSQTTGGAATGGNETSGAGGDANGGTGAGGTSTGGANGNGSGGGTSTGGAPPSGGSGGAFQGDPALLEKGWELVWSDEFDGTAIDTSHWEHEINCWGGGNNEEQCYGPAAKNSFVKDGSLHIVAIKDSPNGRIGGPDDDPTLVTRPYSSARIRSLGRGDFKYGRMEARMRLPTGQGLWPAFWMLPSANVYGGWAQSGEIDIMEAVNPLPGQNIVHGTLHYGAAWPENVSSSADHTPSANVWETFYTYAVEWEEGEIRWFVDDFQYASQTEWYSEGNDYPAPFDQEFHLILNLAVGGNWPGAPNAQTTFPQEMSVDYVRVYQCTKNKTTGAGCGPNAPPF